MLLDTSGLLAYHQSDPDAATLFEASGVKLTHSYVLSEFITLAYARRLPRMPALAYIRALLAHPLVEVVWVDETLHRQAMSLMESRPDKEYSLCDAVSFVLMQDRSLREAYTTDHHFAQEGFQRLLLPKP